MVDAGRVGDRLEHRSRFVRGEHRRVVQHGEVGDLVVFRRLEIRIGTHGEDRAGVGIPDEDGPGIRLVRLHGLLDAVACFVLDRTVDGQHDVGSVHGLLHMAVSDDEAMAARVLLGRQGTGRPRQKVVESPLDAVLPHHPVLVVRPQESDELAAFAALRIQARIRLEEADPFERLLLEEIDGRWRHVLRDHLVCVLGIARQLRDEVHVGDAEGGGKLVRDYDRVLHALRHREHGPRLAVRRERIELPVGPVADEDAAARRQELRFEVVLVRREDRIGRVVHDLQLDQAHDDRHAEEREHPQEDLHPRMDDAPLMAHGREMDAVHIIASGWSC